jgi:hypothetical protein
MANHVATRFSGPQTEDALTAEREKMWAGFAKATTATVIFVVLLLIAMAVFLL